MRGDDVTPSARKPKDVQAEIKRLESDIAAQHRRIAELESLRTSAAVRGHPSTEQPSRRDLLRRAGIAAAGAAGAAGGLALLSTPAAATQGSAILAGLANDETLPTTLSGPALGATFSPIFHASTAGTNATATAILADTLAGDTALQASGGAFGVIAQATTPSGIGVWSQANVAGGVGIYAAAGGRAPLAIGAAAAAGPPTTDTHARGDMWMDSLGTVWVCVTAGTPGVFAPLQTGGANLSHFVKASHQQYTLTGSDGATWMDMDATNLALSITPAFNSQAIVSANADLWTSIPGLNQDIGIYIEGGTYGAATAGTIVAWKESGGFAGTFSPNAAFLETTQPLVAGTPYLIKLRWKTNKPAGPGTIVSGAGPLPPSSAGGGVAGQFSPTRLVVFLVQDHPNPSLLTIPTNNPNLVPAAPKVRVAPAAPSRRKG